MPRRRVKNLPAGALLWPALVLAAVLGLAFYSHVSAPSALPVPPANAEPSSSPMPKTASHTTRRKRGQIVRAAWYDVPAESIAARRAQQGELTAAHNRLPLGTLVRVTHLANGRDILVRVTDRGIHNRRIQIDLCREAAERLQMLEQGIARVRLEVMPETAPRTAALDLPTAAGQP